MIFLQFHRPRPTVFLGLALFVLLTLFSFQQHVGLRSNDDYKAWASLGSWRKSRDHPLKTLHLQALQAHEQLLLKQSITLDHAVAEYQRRYRTDPPAGFDKWFDFAVARGVRIIDEFDTVVQQTKPFQRFTESICDLQDIDGSLLWDNRLTRLCFKNGAAQLTGYAESWYNEALNHMVAPFAHLVPDVCVLVNTYDEPRVILPHSRIENLKESATSAQACTSPTFLDLSHQLVWPELVLPCDVNSPARGGRAKINEEASQIQFVQDMDEETDLCLYNESIHHGLALSPANLKFTHTPLPILSPSKLSTFQDILFPDVWRFSHMEQMVFQEEEDRVPDTRSWDEKSSKVYWRGSTTGGYASDKRWTKFHRHEMVCLLQSDSAVEILESRGKEWHPTKSTMSRFHNSLDVRFSSVFQCENPICDEQRKEFEVAEREPLTTAWNHRYVLDMDGNGLSGRLYDLLASNSAVMRRFMMREWHDERLKPWLHYIPISNDLGDMGEILHYFLGKEGLEIGAEIAKQSRQWAGEALRMEDMQVYLFRVLLELGRRQ
ncbi:MAG: F-actin-capping protein subunit beta [Vezdaea aestivalis]|nr:MAG: F-actin-capping protein subunit beta [Vezdaea aestivalis]